MRIKPYGKILNRNIDVKDIKNNLYNIFASYENFNEIKSNIDSHNFILSKVGDEFEFFVCDKCNVVANFLKSDIINSIILNCNERMIKNLLE